MKRTDMEKLSAVKLLSDMKKAGTPQRFAGDAPVADRREQRRLDQAAGLVSFPVKLTQPVIDAVCARATEQGVSSNEVIDRLLAQALGL